MAVFSAEQLAAIAAAKAALTVVREAHNGAELLLDYLDGCERNPLLDGKASGGEIIAAAVPQWAGLKAAIIAAGNALP